MSSEDSSDDVSRNGDGAAQSGDSVASKLSRELNNWRQRRTTSRPRRPDRPTSSSSEPARTIKVRGHETLVIRKPKLAKPAPNSAPADE